MESFWHTYDDNVALFYKHLLLGDAPGILQDTPIVIAIREMGYDVLYLFVAHLQIVIRLSCVYPIYINLLWAF